MYLYRYTEVTKSLLKFIYTPRVETIGLPKSEKSQNLDPELEVLNYGISPEVSVL